MRLHRAHRTAVISLVPMIDVLLILLVFFMVTSSFLNLDMIRLVDGGAPVAAPAQPAESATLVLRVEPGGTTRVRGQSLDLPALAALTSDRVADDPLTQFLLLPAPRASVQDLVGAMESLTLAGVTRLRVIRLEGAE